jgi:hypothetical protein
VIPADQNQSNQNNILLLKPEFIAPNVMKCLLLTAKIPCALIVTENTGVGAIVVDASMVFNLTQ